MPIAVLAMIYAEPVGTAERRVSPLMPRERKKVAGHEARPSQIRLWRCDEEACHGPAPWAQV